MDLKCACTFIDTVRIHCGDALRCCRRCSLFEPAWCQVADGHLIVASFFVCLACCAWEWCVELIAWVFLLLGSDFPHLLPSTQQCSRLWHVMSNFLVDSFEVVARHLRKHVVLDVVVHVPVEELQ